MGGWGRTVVETGVSEYCLLRLSDAGDVRTETVSTVLRLFWIPSAAEQSPDKLGWANVIEIDGRQPRTIAALFKWFLGCHLPGLMGTIKPVVGDLTWYHARGMDIDAERDFGLLTRHRVGNGLLREETELPSMPRKQDNYSILKAKKLAHCSVGDGRRINN